MYNKPCSQQEPKYSSVHIQAFIKVPEFRQNSLHLSDWTSEAEHGHDLTRFWEPPPHDREHPIHSLQLVHSLCVHVSVKAYGTWPQPLQGHVSQEHVSPSHVPANHNDNNTTCPNSILSK